MEKYREVFSEKKSSLLESGYELNVYLMGHLIGLKALILHHLTVYLIAFYCIV